MQKFFTSLLLLVFACSFQLARAQENLAVIAPTSPASACGFTGLTPISVSVTNVGNMDAFGGFFINYDFTFAGATFTGGADYNFEDVYMGVPVVHTFTDLMDFTTPGTYTIKVYVNQFGGDMNQANDTLVFNVTNYGFPIPVDTVSPYFEDFEGPTTWAARGTNSTWALGTPAKAVINSAYSGVNSWVTHLTGVYENNEQSMVESPCFDFTGLNNPEIEMAVWWNSQNGIDGTKLQSSIDAGVTWQNVGQFGPLDSINWYNDNSVTALPSPSQGWTGNSGGWVIARHDLTGLENQPSVKLRVFFGSNANTPGQGFAFDNVSIREKTPNDIVLLGYQPYAQGCGLGTAEHVTLRFFNNGQRTLEAGDFELSYQIGATGTPVIETYAGPDVPYNTYGTYTFTATENFSVANVFDIQMAILFPLDQNSATNLKNSIIYNSVVSAPYTIDFEDGTSTINLFSITTSNRSRILINQAGANSGNFGMIMDGDTEQLGWSAFDALVDPWGANSNPDHFSRAVLCVKIPDSLETMKLSFWLKQMYHQDFLNTNFRLTVNGAPIPFKRAGVLFTPSGNQKALRPPVTVTPGVTNEWQLIEADLTPFIDTSAVATQIGFESMVRYTYNFTSSNGTANLLDSIRVETTFLSAAPENMLSRNLQVYPNPSNGKFVVDLTNADQGRYTFEVMDITGKLITRETARMEGQPSVTIDLGDQPKGIYILKVASDKNVATRKIVIE